MYDIVASFRDYVLSKLWFYFINKLSQLGGQFENLHSVDNKANKKHLIVKREYILESLSVLKMNFDNIIILFFWEHQH